MKNALLITCYSLLLAAGLVALARFFHPATFSSHVIPILLTLFAISAVIYLWRHD